MNTTNDVSSKRTWAKRTVVIGSLLGVAMATLSLVFHSSPPAAWRSLAIGEKRSSIIQRIGTSDADMRDLKGYEAWNSKYTSYFGAKGYWHMLLNYEPSGHVAWREFRFVPLESGGYNTWIPPQLMYRIKTMSVQRTR